MLRIACSSDPIPENKQQAHRACGEGIAQVVRIPAFANRGEAYCRNQQRFSHQSIPPQRLTMESMILSTIASPLALALFFFQDDAAAPPTLVGSPGAALVEMVRNSGPVALASWSFC